MDSHYRKTYMPLIAWIIGMTIAQIILLSFIQRSFAGSEKTMIAAGMIAFTASIWCLLVIIYLGEYVYWINGGPSFKEAVAMTKKERKAYAYDYLKSYRLYAVIACISAVVLAWIDAPNIVIIAVTSVLIILWVISTLSIQRLWRNGEYK